MNRGTFFSSPEDNKIHVDDTIMVYEEKLKAGLYEGASILLTREDCNQSDYSGFSAL